MKDKITLMGVNIYEFCLMSIDKAYEFITDLYLVLSDFQMQIGKQILDEMGIPYTKSQAVQLKKSDYDKYDFIIGMDSANMRNINRIIGYDKDNKIRKLLTFAHQDRDVADPWYTRDFKTTYDDVLLGCTRLFEYIMNCKK